MKKPKIHDGLWAVSAQLEAKVGRGKWTSTTQVPIFYLDPKVQGILDAEHAIVIARDILGHRGNNVKIHVCVQAVDR